MSPPLAASRSNAQSRIPSRLAQPPRVRRIRTMPRMQRPPVVPLDERPTLRRQSDLDRILVHVPDRAPHFVRMIEKDLPSVACEPGGMRNRAATRFDQPAPARFDQLVHHLFGRILVLANNRVNMVRHNGASVTGIAFPFYDGAKGFGN